VAARHAWLGSEQFEQLQILKFAWHVEITDQAAINNKLEEVVDMGIYEDFLSQDFCEAELYAELAPAANKPNIFDLTDLFPL